MKFGYWSSDISALTILQGHIKPFPNGLALVKRTSRKRSIWVPLAPPAMEGGQPARFDGVRAQTRWHSGGVTSTASFANVQASCMQTEAVALPPADIP